MIELILGGARSGKSTFALQRARDSGKPVVFIATAQADDAEMLERIALHRTERPRQWCTVEPGENLAAAIKESDQDGRLLIVDCITLWIARVLFPQRTGVYETDRDGWQRARSELLEVLRGVRADIVLVSNEVGLGLVPDSPVGRLFRDEQGRMNQELARISARVTLMAAGLPLTLKPTRP